MERPDSDLDAMAIVQEEYFAKRQKINFTSEAIKGLRTYEGGYFDIKYMTKEYIKTAAEIVYMIYQLILQENHILFPSNCRLEETVENISNKPEGIV